MILLIQFISKYSIIVLELGGEHMYKINSDCIKCGACASVCPVGAISEGDDQYNIDEQCIDCGSCASVCPVGAISPGE